MVEGMYRAEMDDSSDPFSFSRFDKGDTAFSISPDTVLILAADTYAGRKMEDRFASPAKVSQIGFIINVASDQFKVKILKAQSGAMNQGFNIKSLINQHLAEVRAHMA
jgi:hypothetical protein